MKKEFYSQIFYCSIISIFLLSSCSKYEDGPAISFRKRKSRFAHDWNLTSDKFNGQESVGIPVSKGQGHSGYFATSCGYQVFLSDTRTLSSAKWIFAEDGGVTLIPNYTDKDANTQASFAYCQPVYNTSTFAGTTVFGKWEFMSDDEQVKFTIINSITNLSQIYIYTIKELRNNEIKLSGTNNGVYEEIKLNR